MGSSKHQQKKPIAAYVRESNGFDSSSVEQTRVIESYVRQRDLHAEIKFFSDSDFVDRSSFEELQASLREGQFETLICTATHRLDDIFDSVDESVNFLGELEVLCVRFISISENFDSSTTTKPFSTVSRLVSTAKTVLKSERTRVGVELARRTGKAIGRPAKLHDDEVNALRQSGVPIRAIAKKLGISTSTVQAALQRYPKDSTLD